MLFSELSKFGQGRGGFAGVDGFGAQDNAFFQVAGEVRCYEGRGGVEEDDVAAGSLDAGEHVIEVASCWSRCRRR